MKMLFAIARRIDGEMHYLRDGWESADAYTDDLGCAQFFFSEVESPALASEGEFVVEVAEDDEGGLSVVCEIKAVG